MCLFIRGVYGVSECECVFLCRVERSATACKHTYSTYIFVGSFIYTAHHVYGVSECECVFLCRVERSATACKHTYSTYIFVRSFTKQ